MPIVVLTVTTNTQIGMLLQKLLSSVSIEIVLKESLQLAANYLRAGSPPQLIILDWSLQDGIIPDFLRQMRALKQFADLPVLVIVEEPDPDVVKEALQAGANRYLTQSFIQANLMRTLREMIKPA
ncbi:MAG: response regulator [Chloroflexi bacterium]|nr:response regulator [Chloroflexota bacterium]